MENSSRIVPSGRAIPTRWPLQPTSIHADTNVGFHRYTSLIDGKSSSRPSRLPSRATTSFGRHHPGEHPCMKQVAGAAFQIEQLRIRAADPKSHTLATTLSYHRKLSSQILW